MEKRKRKRGIKASRDKLENAMLAKGFKTQRELAEHIAREENIDVPPKDLVNKVFREQAVSINNLNRIAKGLGVEPHSLYLAKSDTKVEDVLQGQVESVSASNSVGGSRKYALFAFIIIVSVFTAILSRQSPTEPIDTAISSSIGKILIIVQASESTRPYAQALSLVFENDDGISLVVSENTWLFDDDEQDVLEKNQAHALVRLDTQEGDFYTLFTAQIFSKKHAASLMQKVLKHQELVLNQSLLVEQVKRQIESFVSGKPLEPVVSQNQQALAQYFEGLNAMFIAHSLPDLQDAKHYFEQALLSDPDMFHAYPQLCLLDVRMSWIASELASLESAAKHCQKAQISIPDDIFTKIARLELLAKTGELDAARTDAEHLVAATMTSADSLAALAEYYLQLSNDDDQQHFQLQIETLAKQALGIEKRQWRAANTLANYYFSIGEIDAAKNYLDQASKVVDHPVILSNLGTMQLCHDELDSAAHTYLTIINSTENNYLGHENLGTVYLMQGDFENASKHKQIALDKQPDIAIHQVLSGLGQAYELNGDSLKALSLYEEASAIIERDELLEVNNLNDELHKLYYQIKLQRLNNRNTPVIRYELDIKGLIEKRAQLGLKARSHLAWMAGEIGLMEDKIQISDEIIQICPVYKRSPEIKDVYL